MSRLLRCIVATSMWCSLVVAAIGQTPADAAKLFKTNCASCHGPDGSGNTGLGKALHAEDLRSAETQKQSDAVLLEVITKGRGKMPAFGAKIKSDDITELVAYIRTLAAKK
ncbi:MAG: cytochrome c, class [Candidatus Sulfotelmatobacter sp.]|nr:cytochrome c, class [Candidatus Sulfotelmatobacter sp.]